MALSIGAINYTLFVDNGDGVYQTPGTGGDVLVNFTADSFIDSPWTVVDRANLTNLETDGRMVAGQYKEVVGFYWNQNDNSDDGESSPREDATTLIGERFALSGVQTNDPSTSFDD